MHLDAGFEAARRFVEWVLDDAASVGAAHIDGNYKVLGLSRMQSACMRRMGRSLLGNPNTSCSCVLLSPPQRRSLLAPKQRQSDCYFVVGPFSTLQSGCAQSRLLEHVKFNNLKMPRFKSVKVLESGAEVNWPTSVMPSLPPRKSSRATTSNAYKGLFDLVALVR